MKIMSQDSIKDKQNLTSEQKINPQELSGGAPCEKSNQNTNQQPLCSTLLRPKEELHKDQSSENLFHHTHLGFREDCDSTSDRWKTTAGS